jgi:molybdopterin-guanine dinucleotide biosynthesis protein A
MLAVWHGKRLITSPAARLASQKDDVLVVAGSSQYIEQCFVLD